MICFPPSRHQLSQGISLLLLAGISVVRIVSTYHVFSQTWDEPAHLATGMEWLERGTYTWEPLHPPLARVAVALGPYLSGLKLTGQQNMWDQGNAILLAHDRYLHNLTLARLGVLPPTRFPSLVLGSHTIWRRPRACLDTALYHLSRGFGPFRRCHYRYGPGSNLHRSHSNVCEFVDDTFLFSFRLVRTGSGISCDFEV